MTKEESRIYSQAYRAANRKEILIKKRMYYAANKKRLCEETQEYYAANREKILRKNRAHYAANREKERARVRKYDAAHREEVSLRARARRAQVSNPSEETISYAKSLRNDPCSYCGAPSEHLDHIVPLSKGGDHDWTNLTAACASCNLSKGTDSLLHFMLRRCEP